MFTQRYIFTYIIYIIQDPAEVTLYMNVSHEMDNNLTISPKVSPKACLSVILLFY